MTQEITIIEAAKPNESLTITELLDKMRTTYSNTRSLRQILLTRYRPIMMEAFNRIGLSEAVASFDGSGDSGMIHEVGVPENFKTNISTVPVQLDDTTTNLDEFLSDFAYEILEDNIAGWENNEGGFGDVTFSSNGEITLEFNGRIIQYQCDEFEIFDADPTPEPPESMPKLIEMNS